MTLIVSAIDPVGSVVMGADTSERLDITPTNSEDVLKEIEFRCRNKLFQVADRVWLSIWNDTTCSQRIIQMLQQTAGDADVDGAADSLVRILEEEIAACVQSGDTVHEMGFHVGGYRRDRSARVFGIAIQAEHSERKYKVFRDQLDPEPGRFRFLYNGQYALADTTVKVLGDLVQYGIVTIDKSGDAFVRYLIERTAAYVLETTGLPLVGGQVVVQVVPREPEQGKRTQARIVTASPPRIGSPPGTRGDMPMPTASIGPLDDIIRLDSDG